MAEARLGLERLGGAYAWRSMLAERRRRSPSDRTFRSNRPIPSPAWPPRSAARMPRASRSAAGCPSRSVTREQALAAFTRGAAYAGFAEDRIGSLEKGRGPISSSSTATSSTSRRPRQLRETKVVETWIAGGLAELVNDTASVRRKGGSSRPVELVSPAKARGRDDARRDFSARGPGFRRDHPPRDFSGRGTARSAVEGFFRLRKPLHQHGPPPLQRQGRIQGVSPTTLLTVRICGRTSASRPGAYQR